jgi:hypothetical protein
MRGFLVGGWWEGWFESMLVVLSIERNTKLTIKRNAPLLQRSIRSTPTCFESGADPEQQLAPIDDPVSEPILT